MGAQENIKLVQELQAAFRARDEERYLSFWSDSALSRVAGVPRALGGVTQGKEQRRENLRNAPQPQPGAEPRVHTIFADDKHVCVVQRVSGNFSGNQFFKGSGRPFTTYECIVYDIENGRIAASTTYMNFLDVYVQAGLVELSKLTA